MKTIRNSILIRNEAGVISNDMKSLMELGGVVITICFFVLFVWFFAPAVAVSKIEDGYWGGYIQDTSGTVRILVDFITNDDQIKMIILASRDYTGAYDLISTSSDENFVKFTMRGASDPDLIIEAKQLYLWKRYIWQRLLVGRFSDFWERNTDDAIRGTLKNYGATAKFAIERLHIEEVPDFYAANIEVNVNEHLSIDQIEDLFLVEEMLNADPIIFNQTSPNPSSSDRSIVYSPSLRSRHRLLSSASASFSGRVFAEERQHPDLEETQPVGVKMLPYASQGQIRLKGKIVNSF